jgi:L-histidine Nalpha-methyltransferase
MYKYVVKNTASSTTEFGRDVIAGLSRKPKTLPSKYFYDEAGSRLFDQITQQPEYYLTGAEKEIIDRQGDKIFSHLDSSPFDLFELGCGNNGKTAALISSLYRSEKMFHYHPIDISPSALNELSDSLHQQFPFLDITAHAGDYQHLLPKISQLGHQTKNIVLFLGANIGNYSAMQAKDLSSSVAAGLNKGDLLLIGMDLKKDIQTMTAAYNDKQGVTEEFNLNLLTRMNSELGANFDLDSFVHHEIYEPVEGAMKSYLVSKKTQKIDFANIGYSVQFEAYEPICVERSQKYNFNDIDELAFLSGFEVVENFTDSRELFVDSLWCCL